MFASHRRTALQIGSGLAVMALLAGCGSSSASSSAGTGAASSPNAQGSPAAVTPVASTPANVSTSEDLNTWLAAVCTASEKSLSANAFKIDPSAIATDPSKYTAQLVTQIKGLSARLRAFAAQLQQIGAPNVPNGQEFTNGYIQVSQSLADAYDQALSGIPANASPQQVLLALGKSVQGAKFNATLAKLKTLSASLDTAQFKAAVKTVPECKALKIGG
jgi:hypothetical protein